MVGIFNPKNICGREKTEGSNMLHYHQPKNFSEEFLAKYLVHSGGIGDTLYRDISYLSWIPDLL